MALTKMKRLEIVGLNAERKRLIEYLQSSGIVDISDSRYDILKSRETAGTISQLESNMSQTKAAIEMLPSESGGLFAKRAELSSQQYKFADGETSKMLELVRDILQIKKRREKNNDEFSALEIEENVLLNFVR